MPIAFYRCLCVALLPKRLLLAPLFAWLIALPMAASAEITGEAAVRAAMIFNLLKFTKWPDTLPADAPLRLCAVDASADFIAALRPLEERSVGLHSLRLKVARANDLDACEVIVTDATRTPYALAQAQQRLALTIGEAGFIDAGGMIGITVIDNRVRFEINLEAMKRGGISLPSQVLQLAVRTR